MYLDAHHNPLNNDKPCMVLAQAQHLKNQRASLIQNGAERERAKMRKCEAKMRSENVKVRKCEAKMRKCEAKVRKCERAKMRKCEAKMRKCEAKVRKCEMALIGHHKIPLAVTSNVTTAI